MDSSEICWCNAECFLKYSFLGSVTVMRNSSREIRYIESPISHATFLKIFIKKDSQKFWKFSENIFIFFGFKKIRFFGFFDFFRLRSFENIFVIFEFFRNNQKSQKISRISKKMKIFFEIFQNFSEWILIFIFSKVSWHQRESSYLVFPLICE